MKWIGNGKTATRLKAVRRKSVTEMSFTFAVAEQ